MIKKILLSVIAIIFFIEYGNSQALTVSGLTTTGRFNTCGLGPPVVVATFISGTGTTAVGGQLVCTDPCGTTTIHIVLSNVRWNQTPGVNWLHGIFFPANAGFSVTGVVLPAGWASYPGCTGAYCSAGVIGGPGFYFDGSAGNSCCAGAVIGDGVPGNNFGDVIAACSFAYSFEFDLKLCNSSITTSSQIFKVRGTADGGTGCWDTPDNTTHTIQFSIGTVACGSVYTPLPTATTTRDCSTGTPNYTATLNGGCGNGNTITWWDAATGGTQVGTGSPFVYDPPGSACPAGTTLWAACCPVGNTCLNRKIFAISGSCAAALTITGVATTNPDCATPTGSINGVTVTGASGTVTYTLNPGGFTNTTGIFTGLTGLNYTLTATDAGGCSASTNVTFTPAAGGGPAPTVTTPVNYCQGAAAVPLTATGTNLLWYTTATGGTGSSTAPTPSTATAGSTNYYVSQTPGACESPRALITVNVTGVVTMALSSAAGSNNQTLCINTPLTNITYSTTGNPAGVNATGLPAGVSGSYNAGTGVFTISGTPTAAGSFPYTVTTTGGCSSATQSGTITVNPNATITLSSAATTANQAICINTAITNITYAIGGGATGATVTGLPTGVTGSYSAGVFTISGTPSVAGTFNYAVTTTGGCGTASLSGTLTVNPSATITLSSSAATTNQIICINTPLTNITYATANGATGATVTGLPAGVTGTYAGGTVTISGTPTASGTFNYTVTTTGGCSTASLSGTITVNPAATITLTSAAATTSQTICVNTALTNITYNVGGGATGATVTGLPAGVTGTFTGGVFTISGTPTVTGPFSYTVTTTGGCSTASLSGSINVNPNATLVLTSAAGTDNQTVSINTPITNITYASGNGATGVTVTGLPAGVTGNFSGGVFTISGTPTVSGTFNYSVTTTGGCSPVNLSGTIIVNDQVTITLSSAPGTNNQTTCITAPIVNISYTVGGGATGAAITAGSLPAGVTGTFSGGVFTISGTPTVSGTFNYTVSTTGGVGNASLSGTIIVNPTATITLTSAAATTSQTVCVNTAIANITYAMANGATGVSVTGLPAGVTGTFSGGVFTISGTPTVSGTFNYAVTTTGGCGSASLSGTITVTPAVTITLTSVPSTATQSVCINTALANITYSTANGVTGVTVTGLPTGVSGSYGGGVFNISGTPTASGTFNYTVTTTGGCGTASLSGTITVNPVVTLTLSSAPATTGQTLCINTPLTNITYTAANGATGAALTGLPAGVTGTYAGGTVTISGTPTASGTFNYTVTTTGGCGTASLSGTITVNPAATITLTSAAATTSQTICVNTALANITYSTANGATGATVTGLPAGVSGNYAGGVFTISGTPTVSGTYNYTVTTSGGCGTASLSGTITVNANVTIALTSAAGTDNQTGCINTPITNIVYTAANATGATVTGLPAGVSGNYSAGIFTVSGTPTVAGTFNYTVITLGGCSTASLSGTIIVNPAATITLTSAAATTSQTVCVNTAIANITYAEGTGATGATVTGLPAGVSGNYAGGVFTISGTPTVSGTFNYTVTTTGGCGSPSLSGTITVTAIPPAPIVISPINYCPGVAPAPLTATGTNLLWYSAATGGTGSTTAPTPNTTIPGTVSYFVSQSTGTCEGPRAEIIVNVNNALSVNIGADTTICQGASVTFQPVVTPAPSTYTWRALNVPNNTIDNTAIPNATVSPVDTARYVLTVALNGCIKEDTIQVNVRWKPIADAGANVAICKGDSILLKGSVFHTSGITDTYAWTPVDSLTTPDAIQTWAHPVTNKWYKFTVTTSIANYGCDFSVYDSVKVVVQLPVKAFAGNDTIAVKGVPHQLHGTGGVNYTWSSPTAGISNPFIQNPLTTLNNDANFYLKVEDAIGCTGYDSIFIKVYEGPAYYMPNAFSPNGDGLNDIFRGVPVGMANTVYFRVFNRFGELMFETNQWLKGWDGTYKGKPQPNGAYVWMVKGVDRNNKTVEKQGTIMLIR